MVDFTIKQIFDSVAERLSLYFAKDEANALRKILLEHYLQISIYKVYTDPDLAVSSKNADTIFSAVERLISSEPLQYILEETEFMGIRLEVRSGVLIPRPETEELVSWIFDDYAKTSPSILDIGTGSGCIAIALAKSLDKSVITAIDVSAQALSVASQNAKNAGVDVRFVEADIFANNPVFDQYFDVIVSNPPYVLERERSLMQPNVLDHEPSIALFVPDDNPLLFYRCIAELATKMLKTNGRLYFEINEAFGNQTKLLLESIGFVNVEVRKDIFNRNRMVRCEKI